MDGQNGEISLSLSNPISITQRTLQTSVEFPISLADRRTTLTMIAVDEVNKLFGLCNTATLSSVIQPKL